MTATQPRRIQVLSSVGPQAKPGRLVVAITMLQGMLLSVPAVSQSTGKNFDRVVPAIPAAAKHRLLENFGLVVGGFSFVREFSWRSYESRAIVGR